MRSFALDAGGPLHLADFGGSGPTLLLVHGLGGSHLNWMLVGDRLAQHHRVLAVDLPGFGRSPRAGRDVSVAANAELLGGWPSGWVTASRWPWRATPWAACSPWRWPRGDRRRCRRWC